jgi:hypothetical protein
MRSSKCGSAEISMLSGFMSQCTKPASCRLSNLVTYSIINMVPRKYQLVENGQCTSQSEFIPRLLVFEAPHIVAEQSHEDYLVAIDEGSVK